MRLYTQRGIYYIEFDGGKRRSLKTRNKREAEKIFRELRKEQKQKEILEIDNETTVKLSELKDLYKKHPDRRNLSAKTHEADLLALSTFIKVIGDCDLNLITSKQIDIFKEKLLLRNLSLFSINSYLRHIRAAINFAVEHEYKKEQVKIKMIKTPEQKPRIIAPDNIDRILEHSLKMNPEMFRIIKFTLYTACRRSEIVSARYENISNDMISVCGKGQKTRNIPLLNETKNVLRNKTHGKIFQYKHVSTISNYFRKIVRSIGIDARFHDLRHTSATQMLRSGIPLEVVQKVLGHSDIRTTQIYAKILDDTMQNELQKLSF